LKSYSGIVINQGIVYGNVFKLRQNFREDPKTASKMDQLSVLETALVISTKRLEEQIKTTNMLYSESVSIIFEAHKLMVNDPIILDRARELIKEKHNAYDSYKQAADEVVEQFLRLKNEYIKNRIIDIEDATERVLSEIEELEYDLKTDFQEPKILLLDKMKPSILINLDKETIIGLISEEGSYNQHSGIIVRKRDIPTMVVKGLMNLIGDQDKILLDANEGTVYINPDLDTVDKIMKER